MTTPLDGVKKTRGRKSTSQPVQQFSAEPSQSSESKSAKAKKSGGSGKTFFSILITACIIGVLAYAWQNKASEEVKNEMETKKKNLEKSLQGKISELESKLSEASTESEAIKNAKLELENKLNKLADAKKEFSSTETGVEFMYDVSNGEAIVNISKNPGGKRFTIDFTENKSISMGGLSRGYKHSALAASASSTSASASSTVESASSTHNFLYTQGFRKDGDKYFFLSYQGSDKPVEYEIAPLKVLNMNGNEIVIVNDASFIAERGKSGPGLMNPGKGGLGAIMNLKSKEFSGISVWDNDSKAVPMEKFEKFLSTIKIK